MKISEEDFRAGPHSFGWGQYKRPLEGLLSPLFDPNLYEHPTDAKQGISIMTAPRSICFVSAKSLNEGGVHSRRKYRALTRFHSNVYLRRPAEGKYFQKKLLSSKSTL